MIKYATGDGLTEMESTHPQFVDCGPVRNGLGPDLRDWTTLPAYRERLEKAKRDSVWITNRMKRDDLADKLTDEQIQQAREAIERWEQSQQQTQAMRWTDF